MIWHNATAEEVLEELSVDDKKGLYNGVADERLSVYGQNIISDFEQKSLIKHFLAQLNNTLTIALIIISLISYVLGVVKNIDNAFFALLIIAIALVNAFISAYISYRSENSLNDIKNMTNPTVTVLREGILKSLNAALLVPGDIIFLEAGDFVPADARIIECNELRVNEVRLTGAEVPVEKDADVLFSDITPIEKRGNMVWAGTSIVHGETKAVVTETNLDTEIARNNTISLQNDDAGIALQNQLDGFGKVINYIIFAICALVFIISFIINFKTENFANMTVETLLNSIALGVAAIPEGFSVIATVVISTGFARLLKNKIIIKDPVSAGTFAKTDILCCDKTGVFTHNKMSLSYIYSGEKLTDLSVDPLSEIESTAIKLATACSTLENDATEIAIEKACLAYNSMSKIDIKNEFPVVGVIPFDKNRKSMTVITMINERPFAVVKGAAETLLPECVGVDVGEILSVNERLTNDALRVVCIAMRPLDNIPANPLAEEIENNLTFVGLLALEDPLRSAVIKDVNFIENSGTRLVMITGDNLQTAKSVARRIGILKDGTEAITGNELSFMSDEELALNIDKYTVFARVSANDKLRIVKAFKQNNYTVTVTGDGIEDADALAAADVGCAIGKFGADVTLDNADIIIKNNRFDTIARAFKESRGIFNNIRNIIIYSLGCNFAELLAVLLGVIFFGVMPVSAIQLLWINLLTDSAIALSLGMDKPYDKDIKNSYVASISKIFSVKTFVYVAVHSVIIALLCLFAYSQGGNSMAFAVLTLTQIFHCYNSKFVSSILNSKLFDNNFMNISAIAIFGITAILILTVAGSVFGLQVLSFGKFALALVISFIIVPASEIIKKVIKL